MINKDILQHTYTHIYKHIFIIIFLIAFLFILWLNSDISFKNALQPTLCELLHR